VHPLKPSPLPSVLAVASFLGPETTWQLCHFFSSGRDLKTFLNTTQWASQGHEDVPGKGICSPGGEGGMEGDCTAKAKPHCLLGPIVPHSGRKKMVLWWLKIKKSSEDYWGFQKKKKHHNPTCWASTENSYAEVHEDLPSRKGSSKCLINCLLQISPMLA